METHRNRARVPSAAILFCIAAAASTAQDADAQAAFTRGQRATAQDNRNQAIIEYTLALRLDPNHALAHFYRGVAHYENENPQHAIADCGNACGLCGNACGLCGNAFGLCGNACGLCGNAIRIGPAASDACFNRGAARYNAGELAPAIADWTQTIHLDKSNVDAYNNRGDAYSRGGDQDLAAAAGLGYAP
jgi:tetratricopeptide (TPR) repeat protein